MPQNMPTVYEGYKPYVFVSYAHADKAALQLIEALVEVGYRVWYDAGIEPTANFPDYIARHILGCKCFVALISRASLMSDWWNREIVYVLDYHKTILPIYLEDVELTPGLELSIGKIQALKRFTFISDQSFCKTLLGVRSLYECLTTAGKQQIGVGSRVSPIEESNPQDDTDSPVRIGEVEGIAPRASLAGYSWAELKKISQAIAAAQSEEEWKAIAREYRLVDSDGKLMGDTKEIVLRDKAGTKAKIRILGFRHDTLSTGGKLAGISFEFADVPMKRSMNGTDSNAGGWAKSDMQEWLNSSFLALLPDDLRVNVAEVHKRTNNKGKVPENDISAVTSTVDKVWLLSMSEVYGNLCAQKSGMLFAHIWRIPWSPATYDAEGKQHQLYANKGVTTKNYGFCVKKKDGANSWWCLRSPLAYYSNWFHCVGSGGGWSDWGANNGGGVSPGFCF